MSKNEYEIIEVTNNKRLKNVFHEMLRCSLFQQATEDYYAFDHDNFFPEPAMERRQLLFSVDGELAAAATLDFLDERRVALRGLAVSADWQGQQIGRHFVQAVCDLAASRGRQVITVIANASSAPFYLKCGFEVAAPGTRKEQTGKHAVLERRVALT